MLLLHIILTPIFLLGILTTIALIMMTLKMDVIVAPVPQDTPYVIRVNPSNVKDLIQHGNILTYISYGCNTQPHIILFDSNVSVEELKEVTGVLYIFDVYAGRSAEMLKREYAPKVENICLIDAGARLPK